MAMGTLIVDHGGTVTPLLEWPPLPMAISTPSGSAERTSEPAIDAPSTGPVDADAFPSPGSVGFGDADCSAVWLAEPLADREDESTSPIVHPLNPRLTANAPAATVIAVGTAVVDRRALIMRCKPPHRCHRGT